MQASSRQSPRQSALVGCRFLLQSCRDFLLQIGNERSIVRQNAWMADLLIGVRQSGERAAGKGEVLQGPERLALDGHSSDQRGSIGKALENLCRNEGRDFRIWHRRATVTPIEVPTSPACAASRSMLQQPWCISQSDCPPGACRVDRDRRPSASASPLRGKGPKPGDGHAPEGIVRNPLPAPLVGQANPLGIPGLRTWGDALGQADLEQLIAARAAFLRAAYGPAVAAGRPPVLHFLGISGGGQWGAFGAGVLNAWSESGTRPEFTGVSGISTGAIIAPFAFLGPGYDDVLEEVYTRYSTDDLIEETIFSGLVSGASLTNTAKLEAIIAEKVMPELLAQIAEEHRKGRILLVGTTNLDAGRPMIWNMGAIAASGHPDAPHLFRQVILASASIPVAFPPAIIEVVGPDGQVYDELHVDGGATSQVTFVSAEVPIRTATVEALGRNLERHIYLIMNNTWHHPTRPFDHA